MDWRRAYHWATIGIMGYCAGQGAAVMWPEWSAWTWWGIGIGMAPLLAVPTAWDNREAIRLRLCRMMQESWPWPGVFAWPVAHQRRSALLRDLYRLRDAWRRYETTDGKDADASATIGLLTNKHRWIFDYVIDELNENMAAIVFCIETLERGGRDAERHIQERMGTLQPFGLSESAHARAGGLRVK